MKNYTIIIPHYNNVLKCKRLLETIPNNEEFEIIVVDDKSTNEDFFYLKNIIKDLSNKNIKLFQNNTSGKGAGCARNIGLNNAQGKWIIFADSDDFFLKDFYKAIEKYKNSSAQIVYFLVDSIYDDTEKQSDRHLGHNGVILDFIKNKKYSKERLNLLYSPWGKMIKKDYIDQYNIKFNEVPAANDAFFSTKSNFLSQKIIAEPLKIYCVTRSKGSITTTISEKNFDSIFKQHQIVDKFLEENGCKYRPTFLREIVMSRKFGIKKTIQVIKIIKNKKLKIFTPELLERVYPINIYEYIIRNRRQKKYEINK